jgi:hypothetical protein
MKKYWISGRELFNFLCGMILGVLASYIYPSSKLLYYCAFCPLVLAIFFLINLEINATMEGDAK